MGSFCSGEKSALASLLKISLSIPFSLLLEEEGLWPYEVNVLRVNPSRSFACRCMSRAGSDRHADKMALLDLQ